MKEELVRISWFMRGGISFSDAHLLSPEDREIINKVIESNLEITERTKYPFF